MKGISAGALFNDFAIISHRLIIVCTGKSKCDEIQMITKAKLIIVTLQCKLKLNQVQFTAKM